MPSQSSPDPRRRRARGSVTSRMGRFAVLPGLVVTLVAGAVAWALRGEWSGLSALVGGSLGVGIFLAGLVGISAVVAGPAAASMAGAFTLLACQLVVGFLVLYLLSRLSWTDMLSLGVTFLAAGLTFQVGAITGYAGARQLVFGDERADDSGREGLR